MDSLNDCFLAANQTYGLLQIDAPLAELLHVMSIYAQGAVIEQRKSEDLLWNALNNTEGVSKHLVQSVFISCIMMLAPTSCPNCEG